ncbi:MAG TPA: CARDB domain-containing protein, partial [Candidatus Poseidoniaceae archaeon]|nr:CARDB domain-containing protein [Candidatus Poseidoniaceae archaeon]
MGRKNFSSIVIIFMLVPLLSTMITVGQAASVEGVSFNSDSISITPDNPVAGTPISIKLTLNNSNTEVTEVDVYFYKNTYESGNPWMIQHESLSASDGLSDSQKDVTVIWQNVNINDQGIYIQVLDSTTETYSSPVFKPFSVQGLPDLIIDNVEISPNEEIHENDLFFVNVSILNQGTLQSNSNSVSLDIEGSGISESSTLEPLEADASTIISFNSTAPQTGTWAIQIVVDSNYEINELDDQNNNWNGNLVVTDIADMYFVNNLVVTTTGGDVASVNGPWILNGMIYATNSNDIIDNTNVPVEIKLVDSGTGAEILLDRNIVWTSDTNQQDFTLEFDKNDINSFSIGTHDVSIIIDSNFEHNGDNSNDIVSSTFQIANSPNVIIEIQETANEVINIESNFTWYVNVQNIGIVSSSGTLTTSWRGMSYGPYELVLNPNDTQTIAIEVEAGLTKGDFTFSAMWQPDTFWMDSDDLDNTDQVVMNVDIPFVVNFDLYSLNITPS